MSVIIPKQGSASRHFREFVVKVEGMKLFMKELWAVTPEGNKLIWRKGDDADIWAATEFLRTSVDFTIPPVGGTIYAATEHLRTSVEFNVPPLGGPVYAATEFLRTSVDFTIPPTGVIIYAATEPLRTSVDFTIPPVSGPVYAATESLSTSVVWDIPVPASLKLGIVPNFQLELST